MRSADTFDTCWDANANLRRLEASTVSEYVAMLRSGKSVSISQQTIVVASR